MAMAPPLTGKGKDVAGIILHIVKVNAAANPSLPASVLVKLKINVSADQLGETIVNLTVFSIELRSHTFDEVIESSTLPLSFPQLL